MNLDDVFDMSFCTMCPRKCGVDRKSGKTGFCGCTSEMHVTRAALHMWEEPCISGEKGSGTVFFSGCTLRCVYCQNAKISRKPVGTAVNSDELADIFLKLQKQGAANINLVTPGHWLHGIIPALRKAKENGLVIPVIYNSSGYENVESLRKLEGLIDVYLPDMKYIDSETAGKYSMAPDYPEKAKAAIDEMFRQTGKTLYEDERENLYDSMDEVEISDDDYENGIYIKKGVIVRHLVLPGKYGETKRILKYLFEKYGDAIAISIMSQYTPMKEKNVDFPELSERIDMEKYDELTDYAIELGISNAFIQVGEVCLESFIPEFDGTGVEKREKIV